MTFLIKTWRPYVLGAVALMTNLVAAQDCKCVSTDPCPPKSVDYTNIDLARNSRPLKHAGPQHPSGIPSTIQFLDVLSAPYLQDPSATPLNPIIMQKLATMF
jgi:hypothetical protein